MNFPLAKVRASFPALDMTDGGRPRVYLDNPAGSLVSRHALEGVLRIYREHNTYFGEFDSFSLELDELVDRAYAELGLFLGTTDPGEIVIGPNATRTLFQLVQSMQHMFAPGDEIVLTHRDHEGNISPWLRLADETGATVRWLDFSPDTWQIDKDQLRTTLSDKTRLVALNHVSNLTGVVSDIRKLAAIAKSAGALVFVDGVQFAPHYLVDAPNLGCDFFMCASYKFFGPHLGAIWCRREVLEKCRPHKTRAAPETLPERFVVGCPPFELLSGLLGVLNYFQELGAWAGGTGSPRVNLQSALAAIETYERELLTDFLVKYHEIGGLDMLGSMGTEPGTRRAPIVSFASKSVALADLAEELVERGVHFHWGTKFAFGASRYLGLRPDGLMRVGLSHYNSTADVDTFMDALRNTRSS